MGQPDRRGDRIDEVWAWVSIDPNDDCEGICASSMVFDGVLMMMPLMGGDYERVRSFRDRALVTARSTGVRVQLVRFAERVVVEELEP